MEAYLGLIRNRISRDLESPSQAEWISLIGIERSMGKVDFKNVIKLVELVEVLHKVLGHRWFFFLEPNESCLCGQCIEWEYAWGLGLESKWRKIGKQGVSIYRVPVQWI